MKKILVIDDEELLIRTMSRLLEKQGYEVYTAKSSMNAEAMVEGEEFDLIVSDIRMPGKNGVEIVRSIEKNLSSEEKRMIPVIFITGFADEAIEKEAMKLKPVAFLMKPFDVTEVLALIEKVLRV